MGLSFRSSKIASRAVKKPIRILVPIDVGNCPLEVFAHLNRFAGEHPTIVTLLHVVKAASGATILSEGALTRPRDFLQKLAKRFLNRALPAQSKVRVGRPAEEIIAEAEAQRADLILMTSYKGSSFGARPFDTEIRGRVMSEAPCKVSILHVRTRFNCDKQWDLLEEIVAALDYVGLLKPMHPLAK